MVAGTPESIPLWGVIVYGVVVGTAGICGDLAESLVKRDTGHKDAGQMLPGLGGVMDVLDSMLIAAPFAFLCWVAEIVKV